MVLDKAESMQTLSFLIVNYSTRTGIIFPLYMQWVLSMIDFELTMLPKWDASVEYVIRCVGLKSTNVNIGDSKRILKRLVK